MIFVRSKYDWARWFAWYPVSVQRGSESCLAWLQYVERVPVVPNAPVYFYRLPGFHKDGSPVPPDSETQGDKE